MGTRLLAAIERLRKTPWVVLALLLVSVVGAVAQFTGAAKSLVDLVHPHADPRDELAKLSVAFSPSAMATAAENGDARAVGLLLEAGMPVDAAPDPAIPPLMLAAQSGSTATVKLLLQAGADPAWVGAAGSALSYAVRYQHPDIVALLLEKQLPQPMIVDAFVSAGQLGDRASIALIAPHVADTRRAAGAALQALVQNSSSGSRAAPAIAALAAFGPDLNAIDANGQTLLHIAVNNDVLPVLTALLKAGANPNIHGRCQTPPDRPMVPPLACAVVRGTSDGLASALALIARHADIEARAPGGITPLMAAAGNGDAIISAALLKAGADPLARDASGKTAIDYARSAGYNDPMGTVAALSRGAARPPS